MAQILIYGNSASSRGAFRVKPLPGCDHGLSMWIFVFYNFICFNQCNNLPRETVYKAVMNLFLGD